MSDDKVTSEPQGSIPGIINVVDVVGRMKTFFIYALLVVVAVEGGVIVWQRGNVATAKLEVANITKKMDRVKLERDLAKSNEATCRINLEDQNGKISDAGKRYDRIQREMVDLAKRIALMDVYKPANDVRNQQTPKSCEEALDFMNRNFP